MGARKSKPEYQPLIISPLLVEPTPHQDLVRHWDHEQNKLKKHLVTKPVTLKSSFVIAGIDISYSRDERFAAVSIALFNGDTGVLITQETLVMAAPKTPYIAGYLAFREVPLMIGLIKKHKPDVVMVDGNGRLHPRRFGSACHLGVICNVPTIGVAKHLHTFDSLLPTEKELHPTWMNPHYLVCNQDTIGAAVISTQINTKPIFVSAGHKTDLDQAIAITLKMCKHRVPEPIRYADMASRDSLRKRGWL